MCYCSCRVWLSQTKRILKILLHFERILFSRFSPADSVLIEEGREITLTVVRLQGSFREVHVSWNVSVDAFPDISPANGTLTFHDVSRNVSGKVDGRSSS